jgi:predicted ATPase
MPPTVQGVLAACIDRLATEDKELLQTLAVTGHTFSLRLLTRVVDQPETALYERLSHLQAAEFLYEQPAFPDPEYTFKHALTQEVAYSSPLLERRKMLHERTAQVLEALYVDRLEEYYSALAHHYSHSSNTEKAVIYLQHAGQQAAQRSAYVEALVHLNQGPELVVTLPDTLERVQQEFTLTIALGTALMATKGWAAPEVGVACTRARALGQRAGDALQLFPVLWGLHGFYIVRAEYQEAREIEEQLLSLAQHRQDPIFLAEAYFALGICLFHLAEFAPACEHLAQSIAHYTPQQHRAHTSSCGVDIGVFSLAYVPHTLWHLGYPDQALTRSQEALTLAQELAHPFSLALALDYAAMLHQFRREAYAARERAEAAMALCTEHGFAYDLAWATIIRGWALTAQGQQDEGLIQIREGLAALQATRGEVRLPYYLALLAEVCGQAGQATAGLTLLAEALAQTHKKAERWREAKLYRLQGEFLLQASTSQKSLEAEENFRQALDVARH